MSVQNQVLYNGQMTWKTENYFLRWLYSQRYFQRLSNRREEGHVLHQGIPAQNTFLQTLSFEIGTARSERAVPGVLTDSYRCVLLLNKGLNLLLVLPKGN